MSGIHEAICENCNFKILTGGKDKFYIDCTTGELVEFMHLPLTKIDDNHKIIGQIMRNYCPNCDKIIKTYLITESRYSEEESINILEEILKKSDINETDIINLVIDFIDIEKETAESFGDELPDEEFDIEYYERFKNNENILTVIQFENYQAEDFEDPNEYLKYIKIDKYKSKINCPECEKELSRAFKEKTCPICDNELICGFGVDID